MVTNLNLCCLHKFVVQPAFLICRLMTTQYVDGQNYNKYKGFLQIVQSLEESQAPMA